MMENELISKRRNPFYMNSLKHSFKPKALPVTAQQSATGPPAPVPQPGG
eukprot:CAMPEP_0170487722 /NCGR_PEP_ID=MMETSP0208-20121228/6471_1 /TAXON_ID=197538 /ORGANISM="Strombidium inclinatum, Strain S3" /LENGTH=48 /DNA_ID= /DNA_START= /DNA_END= /DNA_ORIENTATION=